MADRRRVLCRPAEGHSIDGFLSRAQLPERAHSCCRTVGRRLRERPMHSRSARLLVRLVSGCLFVWVPWRANADAGLTISWTNNLLTVSGWKLPGGNLEILYLEAFCRGNSTHRDWRQTTLTHRTALTSASRDGKRLRLLTRGEPGVEVVHDVRAGKDEVEFVFRLTNRGREQADLEWFQPACIRVDRFTGRNQSNYIDRSFIFTEHGLTTMNQTTRREEALYRGGQAYVPANINLADV